MISSQTVIAKIIADADLREDEIRISDIREWINESILKIGAVPQYEHKVAVLPIIGHQAELPCDLYKLGQVAYSTIDNGGWLPMRRSSSSYGVQHDNKCARPCMLITDDALIPLVKNMFNLIDDKAALEKLSADPQMRNTLSALVNQYTTNFSSGIYTPKSMHRDDTNFSRELQYTTKPGYIITSQYDGFVKIAYYAIYTDDEGMPMIPNMESYKECIYWYVMMKLMYPRKLRGQISQQDYYDIRNSYNFYRKQAYAEMMMPGVDGMESIKNNWLKLYPEIDEHDRFFSTAGDEQQIYNQNTYWP